MNLSKQFKALVYHNLEKRLFLFLSEAPCACLQTAIASPSLGPTASNLPIFQGLWFSDAQLFLFIFCKVPPLGLRLFALKYAALRCQSFSLACSRATPHSFSLQTPQGLSFPTSLTLLPHLNSLPSVLTSFLEKSTPPIFCPPLISGH